MAPGVPTVYNKIRYMMYLICIANICIHFDGRQYYYNIVYFKQTVAVMKKAEFSKQWEMDNNVSCCINVIVKHNRVQMFEVAMMLKKGIVLYSL
jgi:hypothetical protein